MQYARLPSLDGDGNLHLSQLPFRLRGVLSRGAFQFLDDIGERKPRTNRKTFTSIKR
jgi:hypothetical protein